MKERGITRLKFTEPPMDVTSDFGTRLQGKISFEGQTKDDPNIWTLNKKSRNVLIDILGNNTDTFVGVTIPIESAITEKGRAIYVDETELRKIVAEAGNSKQESID